MNLSRVLALALCALPCGLAQAAEEASDRFIARHSGTNLDIRSILQDHRDTMQAMLANRHSRAKLRPLLHRMLDDEQCLNDRMGNYVKADEIISGLDAVILRTADLRAAWETVQIHLPLEEHDYTVQCRRARDTFPE